MFNKANAQTIDLLLSRRSEKSKRMTPPGPNAEQLKTILQCGIRVSDHGKIGPWRFVVFEGEAQNNLARIMSQAALDDGVEENSSKHIKLKEFATQAPCLIAVISKPNLEHKVPEWEQRLSVGAACQNIIIASHALGFVAQWLTGDSAYSQTVRDYFDLNAEDKIAGFIFIGSSDNELKERPRPEYDDIVSFWEKI